MPARFSAVLPCAYESTLQYPHSLREYIRLKRTAVDSPCEAQRTIGKSTSYEGEVEEEAGSEQTRAWEIEIERGKDTDDSVKLWHKNFDPNL